ncbi:hypothetical protein AAZX31_11G054300 [Glycine max]|nr:hypothetical protein GYH30_030129 [Glycine max]KAH1223768.1 hypothetical protein GmHk_11G031158 [Glycine max]KHN42083.1 hypothetical protein glysoja_003823 [Glycine soja]
MSQTNAMNYSPRNSIPTRDKEVNWFRESPDIFDKLFQWLFGVIAFKTTPMREALYIAHPNVMMAMVLMIFLYFSLWLLGTMLPQRSGTFLIIILVCIMMVIASVSSVLVMTIISPLLAWLRVMSWGWHFCFVCLLLLSSALCIGCACNFRYNQAID